MKIKLVDKETKQEFDYESDIAPIIGDTIASGTFPDYKYRIVRDRMFVPMVGIILMVEYKYDYDRIKSA